MGEDSPESERRKWEIICYRVFIGDWSNNKLSKIFNAKRNWKRGRKSQNKIISDLHLEAHKLCQIHRRLARKDLWSKRINNPKSTPRCPSGSRKLHLQLWFAHPLFKRFVKRRPEKGFTGIRRIRKKQSKKVPKDQRRLLDTIDRKNRDFEASRKKNQKEEKTSNLTRPRLENNLLRNREEDFGSSSSEDDDSDSLEDARNTRSGSEEEEEVEPLGEERREDLNFLLNATSASKRGFNYFRRSRRGASKPKRTPK